LLLSPNYGLSGNRADGVSRVTRHDWPLFDEHRPEPVGHHNADLAIALRDGIGPGDAYVGFWKTVANYRRRLSQIVAMLKKENLPPETRRELKKDMRYYSEQVVMIYGKVIGFERPLLKSIQVKGDPDNPLNVNMDLDLSGLSDEELVVLARILPKLGGASAAENSAVEDNAPKVRWGDYDDTWKCRQPYSTGCSRKSGSKPTRKRSPVTSPSFAGSRQAAAGS
jgi:hypothetical protein